METKPRKTQVGYKWVPYRNVLRNETFSPEKSL